MIKFSKNLPTLFVCAITCAFIAHKLVPLIMAKGELSGLSLTQRIEWAASPGSFWILAPYFCVASIVSVFFLRKVNIYGFAVWGGVVGASFAAIVYPYSPFDNKYRAIFGDWWDVAETASFICASAGSAFVVKLFFRQNHTHSVA